MTALTPTHEVGITSSAIDEQAAMERVFADGRGAIAVFSGIVRPLEDGKPITGIQYEHHDSLADTALADIAREAVGRFGLLKVYCVHRVGFVPVGQSSVYIAVAASHRGPSFDACRWIIDEIKSRVPIWKTIDFPKPLPTDGRLIK